MPAVLQMLVKTSRSRYFPAVLSALVSLAVYVVCLRGTYIYDDRLLLEDDPRTQLPIQWVRLWKESYNGGVDLLYRPLTSMTYAVQNLLHRGWAMPFHLVNWLLHAAVVVVLVELVRRCSNARIAMFVGLIFAIHPIHVEVVVNIVGRAEELCALFTLGALLIFVTPPLTTKKTIAILFCTLCAIGFKEQGILMPAFLLFAWYFLRRQSINDPLNPARESEQKALKLLLILICWAVAGYIITREQFLKFEWDRSFLESSVNPVVLSQGWDKVLMPLVILGRYSALMIAPVHQSIDYGARVVGSHAQMNNPYLWIGIATSFAWLITFIVAMRKQSSLLVFALLCAGICYGLIGNIVTIIGTVMGERLLYLPSAFLLIAAGVMWNALPKKLGNTLLIVLVALGTFRTVDYSRRWNDRLGLYEYLQAQQPDSANLYALVAEEYRQHGDLQSAAEVLSRGRNRIPENWGLWVQSAIVATDQGKLDDAQQFVDRAFQLRPMPNLIGVFDRLERLKQFRAKGLLVDPASRPARPRANDSNRSR